MNKLTKIEMADNWEGFYISTNDGVFSINRIDYDIYFKPEAGTNTNDRYLNQKNFYTFRIYEDDDEVYTAFDQLYTAVENRTPYSNSIYEFEEKDYVLPEYIDMREDNKLLKDGKIKWHSDACDYDKGSVLIIEKNDDHYGISFVKSAETDNSFPTFTVRVSIASGRYYQYSTTFTSMYQYLDSVYNNKKDYMRVRK